MFRALFGSPYGESVVVVQNFGDRAVVVEREDGDRRIIPVLWTSLAPLVSWQLSDGRTIRIAGLATAVGVVRRGSGGGLR
jgi:hypothetical protein